MKNKIRQITWEIFNNNRTVRIINIVSTITIKFLCNILCICNPVIKNLITSEVVIIYTRFVSMLTQTPVSEQLLPLNAAGVAEKSRSPIYDADPEQMLASIVPQYVGGIVHCAICEALASESGARRTAMNSANKNAEEMISTLMLKYNRARQAVITQEITEIVSGADAMN